MHALVFIALLTLTGRGRFVPQVVDERAIEVAIVDLPPPPKRTPPSPVPKNVAPAPKLSRPLAAPAPVTSGAGGDGADGAHGRFAPGYEPAREYAWAMTRAVRTTVGCSFREEIWLSPAELDACDERLGRRAVRDKPKINPTVDGPKDPGQSG